MFICNKHIIINILYATIVSEALRSKRHKATPLVKVEKGTLVLVGPLNIRFVLVGPLNIRFVLVGPLNIRSISCLGMGCSTPAQGRPFIGRPHARVTACPRASKHPRPHISPQSLLFLQAPCIQSSMAAATSDYTES